MTDWRPAEETEKRQMQEDIEGAWGRIISDRNWIYGCWGDGSVVSTEDDIKLLKWALGIK